MGYLPWMQQKDPDFLMGISERSLLQNGTLPSGSTKLNVLLLERYKALRYCHKALPQNTHYAKHLKVDDHMPEKLRTVGVLHCFVDTGPHGEQGIEKSNRKMFIMTSLDHWGVNDKWSKLLQKEARASTIKSGTGTGTGKGNGTGKQKKMRSASTGSDITARQPYHGSTGSRSSSNSNSNSTSASNSNKKQRKHPLDEARQQADSNDPLPLTSGKSKDQRRLQSRSSLTAGGAAVPPLSLTSTLGRQLFLEEFADAEKIQKIRNVWLKQ
jgi:hypothetical protein